MVVLIVFYWFSFLLLLQMSSSDRIAERELHASTGRLEHVVSVGREKNGILVVFEERRGACGAVR